MDLPTQNPETLTRSETLAPASLNREAGTVDVVLSTGAAVRRAGYVERLAADSGAVTVAPRLPVLDSHKQTKQVGSGWPTDFGCDSVFRWFRGGSTWLENLL